MIEIYQQYAGIATNYHKGYLETIVRSTEQSSDNRLLIFYWKVAKNNVVLCFR